MDLPMRRPAVVVFDVIDTCFRIEALADALAPFGLGAEGVRRLYAEALRDAMALACVGRFAPFAAVMSGALASLLAETGQGAPEAERTVALSALRRLPPHPDLGTALRTLREGGVRVAALSNGAVAATQALFEGAGLASLLEAVLSVEAVGLAKPRPEVYRHALDTLGVAADAAMMVACHPWDLQGARTCGLRTGYVARGKPYPAPMGRPDVEAETLADVARRIVALAAA